MPGDRPYTSPGYATFGYSTQQPAFKSVFKRSYQLDELTMKSTPLPAVNDLACRAMLLGFQRFGYPKLTFEEVRASADRVHAGTDSNTNVIDVMVRLEIQNNLKGEP